MKKFFTSKRSYTLLIVPESSSKVRQLKVAHTRIVQGMLVAIAAVGVSGFMAVHYAYVVDQVAENRVIKNENIELRTRLRVVKQEISRVDNALKHIDHFATRLNAITQLNDPERNLAMGPLSEGDTQVPEVLYASGERIDQQDELLDSTLAMRLLESQVDEVRSASLEQEAKVRDLHDYLAENAILMSTTPSVRPTKSKLLTSTFGVRLDPYTEHRVMHKGVDFAADHGADVVAPADGTVIFSGNRGAGYGKTLVLDHGFGVQTHFGHLAEYKVAVGDKVRRRQVIGAVGNTGRSTGAHLHYEVRMNGVPQDPERFILD